jgi:hypothetical protein
MYNSLGQMLQAKRSQCRLCSCLPCSVLSVSAVLIMYACSVLSVSAVVIMYPCSPSPLGCVDRMSPQLVPWQDSPPPRTSLLVTLVGRSVGPPSHHVGTVPSVTRLPEVCIYQGLGNHRRPSRSSVEASECVRRLITSTIKFILFY